MASIITGLFNSQSQSKKISEDLRNAGIPEDQFIIYLHEKSINKEIKTNIWQSFFRDNTKLEDENLVVSVKANEKDMRKKISQIFSENNVLQENYIENIKFEDAESLKFLKRIVSIRARAAIYSSPQIKHREQAHGINSEVFFGKNY